MTLILQLHKVSRNISADPFTATSALTVLSDDPWNSNAGGGDIPANTTATAVLVRESLQGGPRIRTADDPGVRLDEAGRVISANDVSIKVKAQHGDTLSALHNVELIGQEAKLWIVGESQLGDTYPIRSDYTLSAPLKVVEGVFADGTYVGMYEGELKIQPTGSAALHQTALRKFSSRGRTLRFPGAPAVPRVEWEAYDPPGDMTLFGYVWFSAETHTAGGTQTLASNDDYKLQIVDSRLKWTVSYSGKSATVTAPEFPRPEAWYRVYAWHDASEKAAALYIEGQRQGTDTGTGTVSASGTVWHFGTNTAESGERFRGFLGDISIFDAVIDEETADGYSDALNYDEPDLYVAFGGLPGSLSVTLDAAAAQNKGLGLVGLPSTGHGMVPGQIITAITGTTNYDAVPPVTVDSTTSVNEIVILATFAAETFGGSETVTVAYATWGDLAKANASAPKNATIKGAYPATGFGADPNGSSAGSVMRRSLGPVGHKEGVLVDQDNDVFIHGDPLHGCDFKTVVRGGESLDFTYVMSLLELYDATITAGDAVANPVLGISRLESSAANLEGAVAADVFGESPFIRAGQFDGVDDDWSFGTSHNSVFTDSFSLRLVASYVPPTADSMTIVDNRDGSDVGIQIIDALDPADNKFRRVSCALYNTLTPVVFLEWQYPADEVLSYELFWSVSRTGTSPTYSWTSEIYIDGLEVDTDNASAAISASAANLYIGRNVGGSSWFAGAIGEFVVFDSDKAAAYVSGKSYSNLWHHPAGGADVIDRGDGTVGIPVHQSPYIVGDTVTRSGFVSYSGSKILHEDTTPQMLVFTETWVEEKLTGGERVYDSDLYDIITGRWPDAVTDPYPASTVGGGLGVMSATITGATWRGGVAPTLPRGVALYLAKHAAEGKSDVGTIGRSPGAITGQPAALIDLGAESQWPGYPLAVPWPVDAATTSHDALLRSLSSFRGGFYVEGDGTMVFGREVDPYSQSAAHSVKYEQTDGLGPPKEQAEPPPRRLAIPYGALDFTEESGQLLEGVADRDRWKEGFQTVEVTVPRVAQLWPTSSAEPKRLDSFWATHAGALAFAKEWREFIRYRRAEVEAVVAGREWMYTHPETGGVAKPFEVVEVEHAELGHLGGTVKFQLWQPRRQLGAHQVAFVLRGGRLI